MFNNKTIFITGGTGSFGTSFIKFMMETYNPEKLIVYSRDELKQFEQAEEFSDERIQYILGDVRDRRRLIEVMKGVDYVVHAAAMKQVVAAEHNPSECIMTNIGGAENIIEASIANNVERVIALSTDKAVSPVNLYGATKLCSDKLFVNANKKKSRTIFSVVRYGNVIGSRGSVIPFFRRLKPSGVLPITNPKMTRFWIKLEDGVFFAERCLRIMKGGEVFVAKLPSMNIVDLATALAPECKQEIIGIRPGEKLHEVMVSEDDALSTMEYKDFYVIHSDRVALKARCQDLYDGQTGKEVAVDFSYRSDKNSDWVTAEQLSHLLQGV